MLINLLNIAILLVIIGLLISSLKGRYRLLYALFVIGWTELGNLYPVFGKVRFELIIGLLVIVIICCHDNHDTIRSSNNLISKYFWLFLIAVLISVPQSVLVSHSWDWFTYYGKKCFIYFFGIAILLDDERKLLEYVWVVVISMFWFYSIPFIHYIQGDISIVVHDVQRVEAATGLNVNGLANNIVQTLPFIYFTVLYERKLYRKAILCTFGIIGFVTVFMTGSRGGVIGLASLLALLAYFSKRKIRTAILVGSISIISLYFISSSLLVRYMTIFELGGSGVSAQSRIDGLIHGISMFIKRPILGVGIGAYPVARKSYFNCSVWAHNLYGQLIGELGILGTLAWALMVYYTIKYARAIRKHIELFDRNQYLFLYYLTLAVEISTYVRLVLGMTNHGLHIFLWYTNAALIVAAYNIVFKGENVKDIRYAHK